MAGEQSSQPPRWADQRTTSRRFLGRPATALVVIVILVTFALAGVSFGHRVAHGQSDFIGLHRQAELVRETRSFIHDSAGPYPPSARAVYQVFVRLPPAVAAAIWFLTATALYFGTDWWLVWTTSGPGGSARMAILAIGLAFAAPCFG